MPPACAQATLQAMTDPNAAGGANVFLGALVSGTAALNGARQRLALTCAVSLTRP